MRGRKPTPTAAKRLTGNRGKRPIPENEPQPPPLDAARDVDAAADEEPTPPELGDDAVAAAEWKRLAPMLRKIRQVTEADRGALLALCLEWSRYLFATAKIKELGLVVRAPSGYPMQNPYLAIATRALSGCNKLWPELGLTPSSRSRVRTDPPPPDDDKFAEFDVPLPFDEDLDVTRH